MQCCLFSVFLVPRLAGQMTNKHGNKNETTKNSPLIRTNQRAGRDVVGQDGVQRGQKLADVFGGLAVGAQAPQGHGGIDFGLGTCKITKYQLLIPGIVVFAM